MDDYIIFPISDFAPYVSFDYIINEVVKFQNECYMNPDFEREYVACEQLVEKLRYLRDSAINIHGTTRFKKGMWGEED